MSGEQVRLESAHGVPPEKSSFFRRCETCGASFIGLAAGKTGERGLWNEWRWYCSIECLPAAVEKRFREEGWL